MAFKRSKLWKIHLPTFSEKNAVCTKKNVCGKLAMKQLLKSSKSAPHSRVSGVPLGQVRRWWCGGGVRRWLWDVSIYRFNLRMSGKCVFWFQSLSSYDRITCLVMCVEKPRQVAILGGCNSRRKNTRNFNVQLWRRFQNQPWISDKIQKPCTNCMFFACCVHVLAMFWFKSCSCLQ